MLTTAHPTSAALLAYGQGRLTPAEMSAIESHLAGCSTCCEALESTPDDTLLIRAREAATSGFRAREQTVAAKSAPPREIPQPLRDHPRYRVLGLIGHGGMGAVYKAEHRKMERLVALKVINPAFVSSPAALERFEREVKTAAKLSHPNIVAAHDADAAGDLHFLVMEFVDGMSLDRLVASKGPLPPNVAANLIYQAALGLQHAHEKGMIHRDIKPQNLMRTRDGSLKILDFGLARLATQALQSAALGDDEAITPERPADATRAGSLLGTPDYIAPEQATDAHLADIRADIYSLGCTLYFLLTGEPPFIGGTLLDKLHAHKTCTPTPIQLRRPEVSDELAAVLDRMLAKDPAERYARPADLAKALKPIAQAKSVPAPASELKANVLPSPTIVEPEQKVAPLESLSVDLSAAALPAVNKSLPTSRKSAAKPEQEVSPLLWIGVAVTAVLMIATCVWLISNAMGTADPPGKQGQQIAKQVEQAAKPGLVKKGEAAQANETKSGNTSKSSQINESKGKNVAAINPIQPVTNGPKKVLLLLPQYETYYPDFESTRDGLLAASVEIETAAERRAPVEFLRFPGDKTPPPLTPNMALSDDVKAAGYDAIIFIGGKSPELCNGNAGHHVKRLLSEFQAANKPICAICAGQHVPAHHGIFPLGTKVAGGPHVREHPDFQACKAERVPYPRVVLDPNHPLITAQESTDGAQFAAAIARKIGVRFP
jgi:serine/threonine protein kinase/putative intracellular protease/amidase